MTAKHQFVCDECTKSRPSVGSGWSAMIQMNLPRGDFVDFVHFCDPRCATLFMVRRYRPRDGAPQNPHDHPNYEAEFAAALRGERPSPDATTDKE